MTTESVKLCISGNKNSSYSMYRYLADKMAMLLDLTSQVEGVVRSDIGNNQGPDFDDISSFFLAR